MMTPQYHDTKCMICETTIHAPVENYVCNTCHDDDYSTVADFIVKQNNRIAALEAQNKKLVEALEQATNSLQEKLVASAASWATGDVAHDYAVKIVAPYRALLSEVTQ